MKPIKLTMSAFGPYKEETIIEFDKLGNSGLFLVTGDTGAGKTTIFDAISFALFNDVSGSNRPISSLRSDFATTENTYVELVFEHKGKIYTVKRTPPYERQKSRGEGVTKNVADASLEYDDKIITKISNVNEKIIEIIGINSKQFKQIAMLAQGEFINVLFAKSDDRTEVFRKIFETDIYNRITKNLYEFAKKNREELESLKTTFETNAENIIWKEKPKSIELIDYKKIVEADVDLIINNLSKETEEQKKEYKDFEKEIDKVGKDTKKLENKILKIKEQNKKVEEYEELIKIKDELKKQEKSIKEDEEKIRTKEKILASVLPKEKILEKLDEEIKRDTKQIKELEKEIEAEKETEKKNNENIKKIEELKTIVKEYNKMQEESKKTQDLIVKIDDLAKLDKEKELLVNKYEKNNKKYQEKVEEYLKQEDAFFKEQAGIIAEKLEKGKPCPVCGSIEHPVKAKKSKSVLTKEELEELKTEKEKIEKEVSKYKEQITVVNTKYSSILAEIPESKETNFKLDKYVEKIQKQKNEINEKKSNIEDKFTTIYYKITEKYIDINEFEFDEFKDEFNKRIKEDANKMIKNKTLLNNTKDVKEINDKEYKEKYADFIETIKMLGFKNEEDYKENSLSEEEITKIKEKIEKYKEEKISNKTKLDALDKEISKKEIVDVSKDEEQLEEFINKQKEQKKIQLKLKSNLDSNEKFDKALQKTATLLKEQMIKVAKIDELSKLASGTAVGKRRIAFEQYVQATYFEMIINEANKRLISMTDNRYMLLRKKSSDKISEKMALDLDVLDNYNGKIRDVKSLSGGESFKAALALALGLSDVIQSYSGGVVIDTLFIDEGFGTLDMESREQAINTLIKLAGDNKLIGIISHVTELKERLDKKIVVSKTQNGSNLVVEY